MNGELWRCEAARGRLVDGPRSGTIGPGRPWFWDATIPKSDAARAHFGRSAAALDLLRSKSGVA